MIFAVNEIPVNATARSVLLLEFSRLLLHHRKDTYTLLLLLQAGRAIEVLGEKVNTDSLPLRGVKEGS